jgi:SAM-dependent methyltransferase
MTGPLPWYVELYQGFDAYGQEPYAQNTVAEVGFIEGVIGGDRGRAILDVGCGIGRHCLELARRGYKVVGVDLSASMLAHGRRAAASEGLPVHFVHGDARGLPFKSHFEVAIMLCEGAFSLMETDAMDVRILEHVGRALRPRGTLIMTAPNAAFMLAQPQVKGFDLTTQREAFTLEKAAPDGSHRVLQCTQRYYTCPELRCLLREAGFQVVDFFACTEGGYDLARKPSSAHFEFGAVARKV